jgi:hypothetical protein
MFVCGHGDVTEYCKKHDMTVCSTWDGDIEKYNGVFRVLVTAQEMSESEYYFLKGKMLGRGIELISTRYKDNKLMTDFLAYQADRRKEKYGGRQPFGYRKVGNDIREIPEMIDVARKIIMLKDTGATLRQIHETPGICHTDGRKISVSTIQQIIKNRGKYEK